MKKSGFTLAELLVTLGIIGVIVAVLIPAINTAMPDENKTMYLKAYDTLSETIKNLASNSKIYPVCEQENNINCSQNPLLNTEAPLMSPLKNDAKYKGKVKLCNLLALSLNVSNANCSAASYNYSDNTFKNNLSFTTSNGMQWKVVQQNLSINTSSGGSGTATFQSDIYVDINGTKGNNCIYSNTCTTPDIFKFMVAADGTVVPADPMGRAYITSRKSLLKKHANIANNNILTSLNDGLRTFAFTPCSEQVVQEEQPEQPEDESEHIAFNCSLQTIKSGIPYIRSDGYIHNLRTTRLPGIYAELYEPGSNCTSYDVRRHYMYNPDTQQFEYLGTRYVNPGDEEGWLKYEEVYQKLKDKSQPPFIFNGKEYKMAEYKSNWDRGNMIDENGNALPQDNSVYLFRP